MRQEAQGAYLIVNADDYGYFRCVSKGILKAATHGIVTATGVLANAPHFGEHAAMLRDCDKVDAGVHLNLTNGVPLTSELRQGLSRWSGRFAGKVAMAGALLSGAVKTDDACREWRAQIERCLQEGLIVKFLNSHEHIHLLPSLFSVVKALASDYGIRHIRFPTSQFAGRLSGSSLFRGAVVKALETMNRPRADVRTARFLGMEASGKLDLPYLERTIPRLAPGEIYELMCHPGEFDAQEVNDARLLRYHDWKGELSTLTSPAARDLLRHHGVRLIGYRHLDVRDDRLVVQDNAVQLSPSH
jgi:chitin disaccharide deacetylase